MPKSQFDWRSATVSLCTAVLTVFACAAVAGWLSPRADFSGAETAGDPLGRVHAEFEWKDAPVLAALHEVAEKSGLELVVDPDFQWGSESLGFRLRNVTGRQALAVLLWDHYRIDGRVDGLRLLVGGTDFVQGPVVFRMYDVRDLTNDSFGSFEGFDGPASTKPSPPDTTQQATKALGDVVEWLNTRSYTPVTSWRGRLFVRCVTSEHQDVAHLLNMLRRTTTRPGGSRREH